MTLLEIIALYILTHTPCYGFTVVSQPFLFDPNIGKYGVTGVLDMEFEVNEEFIKCSVVSLNYLKINLTHAPTTGLFDTSYEYALPVETITINTPNLTCPFAFEKSQLYITRLQIKPGSLEIEEEGSWDCLISERNVCDGIANCLTDECNCGANSPHVFYCATQPGCVPFDELCDGRADCLDQSDECLCHGFVEIRCPGAVDKTPICLSSESYCIADLAQPSLFEGCYKNVEVKCNTTTQHISPLVQCIDFIHDLYFKDDWFTDWFMAILKNLISDMNSICSENIADYDTNNWKTFTSQMIPQKQGVEAAAGIYYSCNKTDDEYTGNNTKTIVAEKVCDKHIDCDNQSDEKRCPGRFYCNNTTIEWVEESQRCDFVKDCSNGKDECSDCSFGLMTSENFLLKSQYLMCLTSILCLAILGLNSREFYKDWLNQPALKGGKIDRILQLQVNFYDMVMGIYLGSILIVTVVIRVKYGPYCTFDKAWRSSIFCESLGVIFSISAHGSLMTISLMSIIRSIIICNFNFINISIKVVVGTSVGIALLVTTNAIIPIIKSSTIRNVFRSAIFFENGVENPFMNKLNEKDIERIYDLFYPNEPTSDLYEMLEDVKNITTDPNLFRYKETGYYGSTPLCIQNIFKTQVNVICKSGIWVEACKFKKHDSEITFPNTSLSNRWNRQ